MAYLGNKPVNNFVSFAKQDITGNGGTSYSLDYPVTGANDIELYINNVRQEPTEAYSCSGSTLTLTGAISSTDDVYVIFRGRALQTAQHPSDSALEATSANIDNGTFVVDGVNNRVGIGTSTPANEFELRGGNGVTAKVTADGNQGHFAIESTTTNYSWTLSNEGNVGRLRFMSYDGTNLKFPMYMYADTGTVTKPHHPIVQISNNPTFSGGSLSSNSNVYFGTPAIAQGITYDNSTGRFTVPVSGKYMFSISLGYFLTGTEYVRDARFYWRKNGSNAVGHAFSVPNIVTGNDHGTNNGQAILNLAANDYVDFYCTYYDGGSYNPDLTSVSVHLIG